MDTIHQFHKITYIRAEKPHGLTRFVEELLVEKPLMEGQDAPMFWGTDPLPPGRLSFMRIKKGWIWDSTTR